MPSLLELILQWKRNIHHQMQVNTQLFSNNVKNYGGKKCGDVIKGMVRHRKRGRGRLNTDKDYYNKPHQEVECVSYPTSWLILFQTFTKRMQLR